MATVSQFLQERLKNAGIKHIFGVCGDYILDFYDSLTKSSGIELVTTTDEAHAGFAADVYARTQGIGAVCVTYNVGAFKVINSIACAYAERSPLVLISGSPGMTERNEDMLLHHMVKSYTCQLDIFKQITCKSCILDDPTTAGHHIDEALECLKHFKQPIYIEVPRDVAKKPISYDLRQGTPKAPQSDSQNLEEALEESLDWVNKAASPVILVGVQSARYGLSEKLTRFAERANIPLTCTLDAKSAIDESHPLFAGIYSGDSSNEFIKNLVDNSDCLLMFGVLLTDLNLCFVPNKFKKRQVISASVEGLKIRNHDYPNVQFHDFCLGLFKAEVPRKRVSELPQKLKTKFVSNGDTKMTTARFFEKINSILEKDMVVVADVGDSLFGASDLIVHNTNHFLSPAFYTSMGFAIPGALGVGVANKEIRPIVIVGDGAFQMSISELSTIAKRKIRAIIFVLNNKGYTTERFLKDGVYNDIVDWNYHKVGEVFGNIKGSYVITENDLEKAVSEALDSKVPYVVNVVVDKFDISHGLQRMTEVLAKRI